MQEMVDEALRHVPNNDGKFFSPLLELNVYEFYYNTLTANLKQNFDSGALVIIAGDKNIELVISLPDALSIINKMTSPEF